MTTAQRKTLHLFSYDSGKDVYLRLSWVYFNDITRSMENSICKKTEPNTITGFIPNPLERSGSVVQCLTRDRRAAGSSLNGVTVLCP